MKPSKTYESPVLDVIPLMSEDIVTASDPIPEENNWSRGFY